jgi:hypothetical protein
MLHIPNLKPNPEVMCAFSLPCDRPTGNICNSLSSPAKISGKPGLKPAKWPLLQIQCNPYEPNPQPRRQDFDL